MDSLFNPKTIAVIGASRHKEKLGYQILNNIVKGGFKGKIYPINPEANEILNLKSFAKITDVQDEIDLAIIIVPAPIVPEILDQCVNKKVANAAIISSGFAEMGKTGKLLQDEIRDVIIKASPLRVLGPNCLGIFNTSINLNATFAAPELVKGTVSAVLQSGALGVAFLDWAKKFEFGYSKFISLGNKVDIEESEIIEYLANDPDTKVIILYLEDIAKPVKFLNICREASSKKPIIILKGGVTAAGARAAFSHTAAMVRSVHINEAIFAQANLVVAQTIEQVLNLIPILCWEPPVRTSNIGIITNAGGPGILTADAVSYNGLSMPSVDEKTSLKLKKVLPPVATISNPLDLGGEAKANDYEAALQYFLSDGRFSSILVLLTPQTATEITQTAQVLAKNTKAPKLIVASFLGDKTVSGGIDILQKNHVPYFDTPEVAIKAIAQVNKYWQKYFSVKNIIELSNDSHQEIPIGDALELVQKHNIPIPPSGVATNVDVAMKIVGRIGFPVAVKNVSKNIVHKYKAGKVVLNVQSESFLKESIRKVGFPVLVQRMVDSPFEIIIGAKRDVNLGVILTFGWGGIFVEDLEDIAVRILPLTELDLDEMIKVTKIGKILVRERIDLSAIKNILIEVCQLMYDFPEIEELDLNPIKVSKDTAYCVDARYRLAAD